MQLTPRGTLVRARGFSLVEVMVALLVVSIGLLGIAKMQALALSNTSGARVRALASLEAASLAATMQADRNYWGKVTATTTATIQNGSVTAASDATLTTAVECTLKATGSVAPCNGKQMAAYDLQQWAAAMQQVMGLNGNGANITALVCNVAAGTDPVSCMITINWTESQVGSNANLSNPSYTLYVDP
jgi:type IV pilus assembly protein PilV